MHGYVYVLPLICVKYALLSETCSIDEFMDSIDIMGNEFMYHVKTNEVQDVLGNDILKPPPVQLYSSQQLKKDFQQSSFSTL